METLTRNVFHETVFPVGIHLLRGNNRNTRRRCEICSKLTIKTPERRHWRWTYFTPCSAVSIINFEHVIAGWVCIIAPKIYI